MTWQPPSGADGARPDWETLNAYVDGELDPATQAEVARAVAADRGTAETVATLSRLKQATGESLEHEAGPDFELQEIAGRPGGRRVWAAAAAVMLAAAIGVAAALAPWSDNPAWLGEAEALHASWAESPAEANGASPINALLLAAVGDFDGAPFVPDFTASKLTLVSLDRAEVAGSPVLHLGYTGTRGCRVSLMVFARGAPLPQGLDRLETDAGTAYAWRSGGLGYLLTASGMAGPRLRSLADAAYEATQRRRQPGAETRTALREQRAASRPCSA